MKLSSLLGPRVSWIYEDSTHVAEWCEFGMGIKRKGEVLIEFARTKSWPNCASFILFCKVPISPSNRREADSIKSIKKLIKSNDFGEFRR